MGQKPSTHMHEARTTAPIIMTVVTILRTVLKLYLEYKYMHTKVMGTELTIFMAIARFT